jgi:GTPase SAR1 family protein
MKLKFIVAGPKGSGKTMISNCIVGTSDVIGVDSYNPTAGVRILEHEFRLNGINEDINVELWDASGDQKYEFSLIVVFLGICFI